MRTLVLPSLATVLALPALGTLAGIDPFSAVGPEPIIDTNLGAGLVMALLACCWLGRRLREGQALSIVVVGWALWALRFQSWAPAGVVSLASAAGVIVVLGSALAVGRLRPAVGGVAGAAVVIHVLGYQPFTQPGCGSVCVETWAPLADLIGSREAVGISLGLEWLAVLLVVGWPYSRQVLPFGLVAAAAVVAAAAAVADAFLWWRWSSFEASAAEDRLRTAAVVGLGIWLGSAIARRMLARRAVQDLVRRLSAQESFPGVAFAVPGSDRWVGYDGQSVSPVATGVELHGPDGCPSVSVPGSWRTVDSLAPVDRFLLDSARLAVVARTRLDDLRASQQRIVAAADAERRRIERDLHDGVQQQLVGASFHLAATRDPGLEAPEHKVREAAAALRDLSHGSLLAVLGSDGLLAALEERFDGTDVELEATDLPTLDPSVERAAYDVVVAAQSAARGAVTIRLAVAEGLFSVICDPNPGPPRQEVVDRVAATGGCLEDSEELKAHWPCES